MGGWKIDLDHLPTEPGSWCRVPPFDICVPADPPEWAGGHGWFSTAQLTHLVGNVANFNHTSDETLVIPPQLLSTVQQIKQAEGREAIVGDDIATNSVSSDSMSDTKEARKQAKIKRQNGSADWIVDLAVLEMFGAEAEASAAASTARKPTTSSLLLVALSLAMVLQFTSFP